MFPYVLSILIMSLCDQNLGVLTLQASAEGGNLATTTDISGHY